MNCCKTLAVALLALLPAVASALSIEIASQASPQSTAPQKWLQLLAELGETNVRVRGARTGDKPRLEGGTRGEGQEARGSEKVTQQNSLLASSPSSPLKLHGILTRREELILPRGRFTLRDKTKLASYLERLHADGAEGITAARGNFDLTKKQFTTVLVSLTPTLGKQPDNVTLRQLLPEATALKDWEIPPTLADALQAQPEGLSEVLKLSQGTALAVLLRQEGLALRPVKSLGRPVEWHVVSAHSEGDTWPIGYEPTQSPSETFPQLFEKINVEVEGYTLQEAIDAIGPQLKGLPLVWDRFALRRDAIDPASIQVKLAPTRTYYKRILDRLLFQARLKGKLRIDEAGQPFLWITR